jgi:hypothetical protein
MIYQGSHNGELHRNQAGNQNAPLNPRDNDTENTIISLEIPGSTTDYITLAAVIWLTQNLPATARYQPFLARNQCL